MINNFLLPFFPIAHIQIYQFEFTPGGTDRLSIQLKSHLEILLHTKYFLGGWAEFEYCHKNEINRELTLTSVTFTRIGKFNRL